MLNLDNQKTARSVVRPTRPLTQVTARVIEGADVGRRAVLELGKPIGVGTSPDNQIQLTDPTVSRYHVELTLQRNGILVRDLESMNGTYAASLRVDKASVPSNTKITLGMTTLLLAEEAGDAKAPAQADVERAPRLPGVVAESSAMVEVAKMVRRLASNNVTVLLQGETGTGKEVLARSLHELGNRKKKPFEVVDCGSMAPTLIASELFGHERGAFTGAHAERAGAFERAQGGTVFLDEIGELPLSLQPALLGVLERRRFKRVGGSREISVDVRVVAATHRDLRGATNTGSFRADLYFRLAVARVVIPPLRDRPEDIMALVQRFTEQLTGDPHARPFDRRTLLAMESHPWSGNVRELRNVVESALAMGSVVLEEQGADPSDPSATPTGADSAAVGYDLPYRDARAQAIAEFERKYLTWLSESCGGNASEAARRARMDRPYLLGLLRKHGLR